MLTKNSKFQLASLKIAWIEQGFESDLLAEAFEFQEFGKPRTEAKIYKMETSSFVEEFKRRESFFLQSSRASIKKAERSTELPFIASPSLPRRIDWVTLPLGTSKSIQCILLAGPAWKYVKGLYAWQQPVR